MTFLLISFFITAVIGWWVAAIERQKRALAEADLEALRRDYERALDDLDDAVDSLVDVAKLRHPVSRDLRIVNGSGDCA